MMFLVVGDVDGSCKNLSMRAYVLFWKTRLVTLMLDTNNL